MTRATFIGSDGKISEGRVSIREACSVADAAERFGWTPLELLEHAAALLRDQGRECDWARRACDYAEQAVSCVRSSAPRERS